MQDDRDAVQDSQLRDLERRTEWRESATFIVALVSTFVAVASVVVSVFQWSVMRDQLKDARAGASEAAVITQRTLKIAEQQAESTAKMAQGFQEQVRETRKLTGQAQRQADIARHSLSLARDVDRPWIAVSELGSASDFDLPSEKEFVLPIGIVNAGRKPGDVFKSQFTARWDAGELPLPPPFGPFTRTGSRLLVSPGGRMRVPLRFTIGKQRREAMARGALTMYVYGRIEYRDPTTGRCYFSHFCSRFGEPQKEFFACPSYNDVGEMKCPRQ